MGKNMYIPKNFEQTDRGHLLSIIKNYPFATLITYSETGIEANHIPLFLNKIDNEDIIQGHFSKANPICKNLDDKSEVLIIFHVPNCYISPNYYPTKKETGMVVLTWNYVTVHVKGIMSFIHDDQWKLTIINNLTNQHEANQEVPWSVADAPDEFTKKMLSAIVGIEIKVSSMFGKWKVSQNQPEINKLGVIAGLSKKSTSDSRKMAELVKTHTLKPVDN
jgi:transcriptional regulator